MKPRVRSGMIRVGSGMIRVGMGASYKDVKPNPHNFYDGWSDLGVLIRRKWNIKVILWQIRYISCYLPTFLFSNLFSICSRLSFTSLSRVEHLQKPMLTSLIVCTLTSHPPPAPSSHLLYLSVFLLSVWQICQITDEGRVGLEPIIRKGWGFLITFEWSVWKGRMDQVREVTW